MILSTDSARTQIAQLLQHYPYLVVVQSDSRLIRVRGFILVYRRYNGYTVRERYNLEINIPIESDMLPFIIDIDRQIKHDYPHYDHRTGKLCLATDAQIRMHYIDGFDLVAWMFDFVEVYYFTYEFRQRFGFYPFGERAHGMKGIKQTYQEWLHAKDEEEAYRLMKFIQEHEYRGHVFCPCGSRTRLRNCHGEAVLPFYNDARKRKLLLNDLKVLEQNGS